MQASLWTSQSLLMSGMLVVLGAVLGYVLAALQQKRQLARLTLLLEQAGQANSEGLAQQQELQGQLKDSEVRSQALQLMASKLQVQLETVFETGTQRITELQEHKQANLELQHKVAEISAMYHDADKQLDTQLAAGRSLSAQVSDLHARLQSAEAHSRTARAEQDGLKDQLASEGKRAKGLESSEHEVRQQLQEAKQLAAQQLQTLQSLQERYLALSTEHTELKTSLQQRELQFQQLVGQLGDTRKSLTQEFENLANKIFEEKGKTFSETSQANLDHMLKPFREQIEGFQKRVNEVHDASLQGTSTLNAEIKKVLEIGLAMSKDASNLTSALKGDSQQRGAWGEAQLRRTLEMSGLIESTHYEAQSSFRDGEGKHKLTDYLIKLPDDKHLIIDSKVSLVAYDRTVAAQSVEDYQQAMSEHVKAVRRHIDDLASKDYTNLVGMRSPSFVLMFMPIEPAYIDALKFNKELFDYGYGKGIVLVSHTTLVPILRTVSNLWVIDRSHADSREISEKAGDIYNQVCLVAERLNRLGATLNTVSNHYNDTVKAVAGKQGLYGKVERFNSLSIKVSKTMPTVDPVHLDFDTSRLSMIVEPIDEPADGAGNPLELTARVDRS